MLDMNKVGHQQMPERIFKLFYLIKLIKTPFIMLWHSKPKYLTIQKNPQLPRNYKKKTKNKKLTLRQCLTRAQ